MKEFFSDEQRKIIKEAIEDHRASLEYVPISDYGKNNFFYRSKWSILYLFEKNTCLYN